MIITEIELGSDKDSKYLLELHENGDIAIVGTYLNTIDDSIYLPWKIAEKLYFELMTHFAGTYEDDDGNLKDV